MVRFLVEKGNTGLAEAGKCNIARELSIYAETVSNPASRMSGGAFRHFLPSDVVRSTPVDKLT
jgi:hypothetical protein